MRRILSALVLLLLLAFAGGLVFIYSGVFNVAASEPHTVVDRWILETTMKQSVKRRAQEVQAPTEARARRVEAGFAGYEEMCMTCHGAPGMERSALGKGLMPPAPDLVEEAEHWKPTELFWIVKHGIKMTGMPAWGKTHSDQELWDVVAFLKRLPSLSAEEYRAMRDQRAGAPSGHAHGDGAH